MQTKQIFLIAGLLFIFSLLSGCDATIPKEVRNLPKQSMLNEFAPGDRHKMEFTYISGKSLSLTEFSRRNGIKAAWCIEWAIRNTEVKNVDPLQVGYIVVDLGGVYTIPTVNIFGCDQETKY